MEIKENIYVNLHLKDSLGIHTLLRQADARGSADIFYCM